MNTVQDKLTKKTIKFNRNLKIFGALSFISMILFSLSGCVTLAFMCFVAFLLVFFE